MGRLKVRLDRLSRSIIQKKEERENKMQEHIDAFVQIFPLLYERPPTQEEIKQEIQDFINSKPADIEQVAAELEKIIYEKE